MELFHLKANIKKRPTYAIFHHNYKIMAKIQKNQDKKEASFYKKHLHIFGYFRNIVYFCN